MEIELLLHFEAFTPILFSDSLNAFLWLNEETFQDCSFFYLCPSPDILKEHKIKDASETRSVSFFSIPNVADVSHPLYKDRNRSIFRNVALF